MKESIRGNTFEQLDSHVPKDKKANVRFWDELDHLTEDFIKALCQYGGIKLDEIEDLTIVKEIQENAIQKLQKEFPTISFPFVDEDY